MNTSSHPYIICHMMSSIEGKIASGIEGVSILDEFMSTYDNVHDQLEATAWMCGRVTMEMFASSVNTPLPVINETIANTNFISQSSKQSYAIAVDTKGLLRWGSDTIEYGGRIYAQHLIVIVIEATPKEYLSHLRSKGISYIFAGKDDVDFEKAFQILKETFAIQKILLEGGSLLNGSLMHLELIDEISLLILPIVINNIHAPSVFERELQNQQLIIHKFQLFETKQLQDGIIWLRYKNRQLDK